MKVPHHLQRASPATRLADNDESRLGAEQQLQAVAEDLFVMRNHDSNNGLLLDVRSGFAFRPAEGASMAESLFVGSGVRARTADRAALLSRQGRQCPSLDRG